VNRVIDFVTAHHVNRKVVQ